MRRVSSIVLSMLFIVALASAIGCSKEAAKKGGDEKMSEPELKLHAVIETSMGKIVCELYPDKAPIGVENFVGLAEGTKEFTDPKTGEKTKRKFYDGLIFHRVIPGFMIQGGDPLGVGHGGPGYQFKNEVSPDLGFDRPGRLAYANAGPDTNGSQFFITHKDTSWLDGGYTIFGQVIEGQKVVDAIGGVATNPRNNMPLEPVIIEKITIEKIKDKDKEK